jgi:hypothetical protein
VSFTDTGTCIVRANQAGNGSYQPAPQVQQSFTVTPPPSPQSVGFTSSPPFFSYYGGSYVVSATATSGLPVVFSVAPASTAVCSVSGSTVSFIGPGTCTVYANQPGDLTWQAAPQVQQSFTVWKAFQWITFTSSEPTVDAGDPPYTVTATASSGLPVTFTIDAGSANVCTISGSTVSFIGHGNCTIYANQPGDANHFPAQQVSQTIKVKNHG